jgi:hypothetical protein
MLAHHFFSRQPVHPVILIDDITKNGSAGRRIHRLHTSAWPARATNTLMQQKIPVV